VAVARDPESTVLAAAVVVPGSAWELPGTEGLTLMSAATVLEQARPALDRLGARARVDCGPAAFTFKLVAPGEVGDAALEAFLDGLFRPAPSEGALVRARTRITAALELDRSSPAWQARLATQQAVFGDTLESGWLGPACGLPETLARFDLRDIEAGARRFAPRMAYLAVLAPEPRDLERRLTTLIPRGRPAIIPAPRSVRSGLVRVPRNTVTTWTSLAFPFGPGTDVEAVRLLGAILADAIGPGVERPDIFTTDWDVREHGAGGVLVVTAVTAPAAADSAAGRVESLAAEIAWVGVQVPVYDRVARRFRGRRLLERAMPEDRAAAMALDLALGRDPSPWPDLPVSPERLQVAARSLGPPARARVGPPSVRGDSMP
jgi:hypothetical protein